MGKDHGYNGMCCCNCRHQKKLMGHPMNKDFGKSSINKKWGYICGAGFPEDGINDQVIFMDDKHGMCEMYVNKNKQL